MSDPKEYMVPVAMNFEPAHHTASWHCDFCNEQVVHHHKPLKPPYDELVRVLRDTYAINPHERLAALLRRVDNGR